MQTINSVAAPSIEALALRCARGTEQRYFVNQAVRSGARNYSQTLRGSAKHRWSQSYQESFTNLLGRLKSAGITVVRTPGPRGGEYMATYTIAAE